jgi:hypothetical protein
VPRGPQGQERPADAVALAVTVGRIATGEVEDDVAAGVSKRGAQGGLARSAALPPQRKSEIARAASAARWS